MLRKGINGVDFTNIFNYFLSSNGISDPYMCLADFDSYFTTYSGAISDYANRDEWTRRALINIAKAGYFASDRSINEYADNIWGIKPIK